MANPTDDFPEPPIPFNRKHLSTNERLNYLEDYAEYLISFIEGHRYIKLLDQFILDEQLLAMDERNKT